MGKKEPQKAILGQHTAQREASGYRASAGTVVAGLYVPGAPDWARSWGPCRVEGSGLRGRGRALTHLIA